MQQTGAASVRGHNNAIAALRCTLRYTVCVAAASRRCGRCIVDLSCSMGTVTELERLPDIEELFLQSSPSTAAQRRNPAVAVGNVRHADCAAAASQTTGNNAAHAEEALQPQVPGTQRLWIRTFGCSHNISDSEYMAGMLQQVGLTSGNTAKHVLQQVTAN